jgi:hypothetical protein
MRTGIKVSFAILMGVFVGPLVCGAAGSAMWTVSSVHNDDESAVARRLYSRTDLRPGYDAVVTYSSKGCEQPEDTAGWDVRLSAFSDYQLRWVSSRYEDAVVTDLRALPLRYYVHWTDVSADPRCHLYARIIFGVALLAP